MICCRERIRTERIDKIFEGTVKLIGFIGLGYFFHKLGEFIERPFINCVQLSECNRLSRCIKVIKVADLKTQSISDVAVVIGDVAHNLIGHWDIAPVVL